ncbi:MAG: helix-turn-helix domain-containing protein [Blastochloris sp.]|nr:helix-turn-helix domain-containing protein [Blastochloris sp.]
MTERIYLTRSEAADYLSAQGAAISKNTLQKFATIGGGPIYRRFGNKALYTRSDLDAWLREKVGAPRRSTSEAA